MRVITSDWHLIGERQEPCDRDLVARFLQEAAPLAEEVILAGDIWDRTRGGAGSLPFVAGFLRGALEPFPRVTYILGNHEAGTTPEEMADAIKLPSLVVTNAAQQRGRWTVSHGHVYDAACRPGATLTPVGEWFTRLDHWGDHIGINIEAINPADWHRNAVSDDVPMHRDCNRHAELDGLYLVCGHSHIAYEKGGKWHGHEWRVLNTGGATKGCPYTYAWIEDDGRGGVCPTT